MDFDALEPDDDYRRQLPTNVWLMDNHKWALLAWEQHRAGKQGQCYTLFHADYHWDGVDDFRDAPEAQEACKACHALHIPQLFPVVHDLQIAQGRRRSASTHRVHVGVLDILRRELDSH